jgi:Ca2+/Na+ antiporter
MDSPPRRSSSAFEYFLYAAILLETALAAVIYTVIFRSSELERLSVYFAIFYLAFLVWSIAQLKRVHNTRAPEAPRESTRTVLGLTRPQLVIVVVVFAMAVAAFSWALRVLY